MNHFKPNKSQTRINLITNIATMIANIIVVIYYTPYLVNRLGVAVYGILPLALIINQYIMVATGMLTNAFTRFYSIAIQKGNYTEASRVISTSLLVVFFIILIITPFLGGLIVNIDNIFQIPIGYENDARLLFITTIISFYFSIISSFLNVTLYALNRLDLMNYMKIARQVLKLVLTIAFFEGLSVELYYVGWANLIVEIILFIWSLYYFFKFKPFEVHISISCYSKITLNAILAMASWVLLQELGDTLLYRTDNILINHYLGAEASGRLGAISELGGYIKTVVQVVGSLFGPLILIAYSKGQHKVVEDMTVNQSLVVGCLSAILCGITAGVSSEILSIWLDNTFEKYNLWLILKLLPIPFYAAGGVMSFVYKAWNQVKRPAILTMIIGLVDFALLIILCNFVQNKYIAIVILSVSSIFSFIQSFILGIYCVYRIYPETKRKFILLTIKIIAIFIISFILAWSLKSLWPINDLITLVSECVLMGALALGILIVAIFNKEERTAMVSIYKK